MEPVIEKITLHRVFKIWRWYIKIPLWIHNPLKPKLEDIDWFSSGWSNSEPWSVYGDLKPGKRYKLNLLVKPGKPYKLEELEEKTRRINSIWDPDGKTNELKKKETKTS
jgi:hypothetical protein